MKADTEGFFSLVYDELRRLAAGKPWRERPGHTLDATALVHEAFVRLGGVKFDDRGASLRAAVAMGRIRFDRARTPRAGGRPAGFAQFLRPIGPASRHVN